VSVAESKGRAAGKRAEWLSSAGVFALGAGVGAWYASAWSRGIAVVLGLGLVCHAVGMSARHRIERRQDEALPRGYQALYWLCWVVLVVAGIVVFSRL
jgi:Flp pilus assembly protein TadB